MSAHPDPLTGSAAEHPARILDDEDVDALVAQAEADEDEDEDEEDEDDQT